MIASIPGNLPNLTSLNQTVASTHDLLAIYRKCSRELRELTLFKSLRVENVTGIESVLGACRKLHSLDIYGIRLNFTALSKCLRANIYTYIQSYIYILIYT